jgi:phosphatidylglycerophosphatase C
MTTPESSPHLALFDFDGTLTNADSSLKFLAFVSGRAYFFKMLLLSPILIAFILRLKRTVPAKEQVFKSFFRGRTVEELDAIGARFAKELVPGFIRPDALKKLNEHRANGDRIVVVSASAELWLKHWVESENLELIATKLEVVDGKYTGKLNGENCRGPGKVVRIIDHLDVKAYSEIHAYGDTSGDTEMLAIATHPNYRVFTG